MKLTQKQIDALALASAKLILKNLEVSDLANINGLNAVKVLQKYKLDMATDIANIFSLTLIGDEVEAL